MKAHSWAKAAARLAAVARRCEQEGHCFADADPVTGRVHCCWCTAFLPGEPERRAALVLAGRAAEGLGWTGGDS